MRIIPGKTSLNLINSSEEKEKFIILAEVVDSTMGFEKPVFVTNPDELLIWFGKNFQEYNYLRKLLLLKDVVLYLVRPYRVMLDPDVDIDDLYYFILDTSPENINTFEALRSGREEEEDLTFLSESIQLPSDGEGKYFKVILEDGYYYDDLYGIRYSYYVQDDITGEYLSAMNDPNLFLSFDIGNRDRLQVSSRGLYSYYSLPSEEILTGEVDDLDIEEFDKLQKDIKSGIISNNLSISGKDIIDLEEEDIKKSIKIKQIINGEEKYVDRYLTYFFTYPRTSLATTTWYYRFLVPRSFSDQEASTYLPINESGSNYLFISKAGSDQPSTIRDLSLGSIQKVYLENLKNYGAIYNFSTFIRIPYSYSMPEGFKYLTNFQRNQEEVYEKYVKGKELYRFESKTVGNCGENIKISIRKLDTYEEEGEQFTVSISRYGYLEVFEGSFVGSPGIERLDNIITRNSKLVKFQIVGQPEESGWIEGDWELLGSEEIEESNRDYKYSLNVLTEKEEVYPDFILIPDKNLYTDKFILDTCERLNCQALVCNSGGNFETNLYRSDLDNRLMYFYGNLLANYNRRPSYSIFLNNLLELDNYLPTDANVFYPLGYTSIEKEIRESLNLNEDDIVDVEQLAEQYRFNYLLQNNYQYYYPTYRSGKNYNTTPLVRFVISKITRELEKVKWRIIGEKVHKVTAELIEKSLRNIQNRFSIIRSISLDSFEIDEHTGKLEASITTRLSDLISSDVSFNIILNYSKT